MYSVEMVVSEYKRGQSILKPEFQKARVTGRVDYSLRGMIFRSSRRPLVRSLLLALAIDLCAVAGLWAQTTPELVRRTPESEAKKQQADRRVTLDIQATDLAGKPVGGLNAGDFTLLDQGEARPLTSLHEINGPDSRPVEAVLVVDAMNSIFEDVGFIRDGVDSFLRRDAGHLPLPVSIVFVADTGVKVIKASTDGVGLANDFKKLQTPNKVLGSAQGIGGAMDRAQRSLHALQMLSAYEVTKPGRKLVIWLGPGWPLLAGARSGSPSKENQNRYYGSIVDITTAVRRAHMTLYSVAPLNLSHGDPQSAFLFQSYLKGVTSPAQADSPQLGVQVLAIHSGGLALYKSGDLVSQIGRCLADANGYYEATFDAAAGEPLGQYRALEMRVSRPGITVRTNTAYYAGPPQPTTGSAISSSDIPQAPLRAQTRLVTLDVTILDSGGLPVTGLKADDFKLQDAGRLQKVAHFEEHVAVEGRRSPQSLSATLVDNMAASNKPPDGTLWNVIAVDLINTPKEDRGHLQDQLEAFAKLMPPGTPVALVSMADGIKVLSPFLAGQSELLSSLKKGLGPLDVGGPANIVERGEIAETIDAEHLDSLQQKSNIDVERQAQRAQMTLEDFGFIAKWLGAYAGKKNVFWLSSGFPIEAKPLGSAIYNSLAASTKGQQLPMQDETDQQLEAARVAIYPLDVRGGAVADIEGETSADTTGACRTCFSKDSDLKIGQRSEMLEIAHATGGVATFSGNLTKSLLQGVQQSQSYYTLSYTPDDKSWDGAYHRFEVAVERPRVRMIYRQGYYARNAHAKQPPTAAEFRDALSPGVPSATSLLFNVKSLSINESAEFQYVIDPSTVQFTQGTDGKLQADLDCAILEFDTRGKAVEKSLIRLSYSRDLTQQTSSSAETIAARQSIALKPGATVLVFGIRDRSTGEFGTLKLIIPAH